LKILILIFLLWPVAVDAYLHATTAEIAVWNSRRVSGPYKSSGDVSTNSPGDWDRILSQADTFLNASKPYEQWAGQPSGSCWSSLSEPPALPGRTQGDELRDAAFVYLLTGTTSYRDAVLTDLLAQASVAGTDFTNASRWSIAGGCASGDSWSWEITVWLRKLLYAYDYIRPGISAGNRTTLDTWFNNAAVFWESNVHATVVDRFPNRLSDDYTTTGGEADGTCVGSRVAYFGGPTTCAFHEGWANRGGSHALYAGLSGLVTGNTTIQAKGKRWFQEWVRFANFADGTNAEYNRWESFSAGLAYRYVAVIMGEMVTLADAFARAGDTSLYGYSTSLGFTGGNPDLVPAGGPKTLRGMVTLFLQHADGTVLRYGTDNGANVGNSDYLIDTNDERLPLIEEVPGSIGDINITQGNLFWRDAYIQGIYTRTGSGTLAYPDVPGSGGHDPYGGEWGTLPGVLFMFGQMENNAANPYLTTGGGSRRRLAAVTNLSGQIAAISPSTASVSLGWTDPNTAIDQSEDGTAVNREVAGTFQQVGSVGPNVTKFSESFPATAGSQQCYIVLPFYNDGLDGADPSNEWCGTVPPCKQKGKSGHC
jgi:hypothetical protein